MALKSTSFEEETPEKDAGMALLSRNFMKFLAKKKRFNGRPNNQNFLSKGAQGRNFPSNSNNESMEGKCFHCHEPGHIKMNCPIRKKEGKEKRQQLYKKVKHALKGTCSDSEDNGSDYDSSDEESAN